MPAHQLDFETGNTDRTAGNRIYPSFGIRGASSGTLTSGCRFRSSSGPRVLVSSNFGRSRFLRALCRIDIPQYESLVLIGGVGSYGDSNRMSRFTLTFNL